MDILIHTLSGTTTAAFLSTIGDFTKKQKFVFILLGGFAGVFPDIDAISLWSKFDHTIGALLHLSHSGNEIYFGKFWYSHHGFFHSIFAAAIFSLLIVSLNKLLLKKENWKIYSRSKECLFILGISFFSYLSHLIGDLPTPGAVWGGIRLFFPFEIYVGGYGTTWWWNNYDVFLTLLTTTCALFLFILLENRFIKSDLIKAASFMYILGISLSIYYATHHSISFAYTGNTSRYAYYERTSYADQSGRLGKSIFRFMYKVDKKLPFYF
jgi:inner membrane protein